MSLFEGAALAGLLSGAWCEPAPVTSVGTDVLNYAGSALEVPLVPLDLGADVLHTRSATGCLRLGGRAQSYTSLWDIDAEDDGVWGFEEQLKLHVAVGTELSPLKRWTLALYVLPGVRVPYVRHSVVLEEHGIDRDYRAVAVLPSLYGYGAIRFWPLARVGVHVDVQYTPFDRYREYAWYPNRVVGAGVTVRGKNQQPAGADR